MYDANTIKTELIGLVGWRQNVDPSGWQLTDLTTSSSGLWFDDIHPLLTLDNLISICPEFDLIDSDQSAINTAFTNWLKQKTESGIIQAVNAWFDSKMQKGTANNLLEDDRLFDVTGNVTDLVTNQSKIVGFEITPNRSKSLSTTITKIGLQFDTNQTIEIKLFKSGQKSPVQTQSIVYAGAGSVQWESVNWSLSSGGSFWLAYDQALTSGNAIEGVRDHTYNSAGVTSFPSGRYIDTVAFSANVSDFSELWDLQDNVHTLSSNFGLNLSYDVRCDYTTLITEQKDLFKTLISLQVGMNLLRELAFNPNSRVNRNESNVNRSELLFEIDGDTQGRNNFSVFGRLQDALNSLHLDTTQLDRVCLPCRRRGVRYKSIGV